LIAVWAVVGGATVGAQTTPAKTSADRTLSRRTKQQGAAGEALDNLAAALNAEGRSSESVACCRRAVALAPDRPETYNNLGGALGDQGRFAEAIDAFRRALALKPDFAEAHSNLLFFLNYDAGVPRDALLAEHLAWAARQAPSAEAPAPEFGNLRDPGRRLKVGYVSPDFREHSVSYFLEPLMRAHDRAAFELSCYANVLRPDGATARLQGLAERWRSILGMDDRAAAELIRSDGIDILVDLAGHTAHNRLGVFALRPAPVQASWLGYPNTTGLPAIGYRITDAVADPEGEADRYHSERLVRLPGSFLCYRPPAFGATAPPGASRGEGPVTFASFNNLAKVTPEVVRLWARLLHAVSG
jgi:predicted O-linked N-acetylglucosamine transferase (SPINDLY family)